jgi:uncharacterized membrane protein YqaE (UPF0057 family)
MVVFGHASCIMIRLVYSTPKENVKMDNKVIQVILCFFIPPLAVYMKKGKIDNDFWINLILSFLGGIPGILHGLYIVLR